MKQEHTSEQIVILNKQDTILTRELETELEQDSYRESPNERRNMFSKCQSGEQCISLVGELDSNFNIQNH